MTAPTFVAKRFLQGAAGDLVNADYIVRLLIEGDKLFAELHTGGKIELAAALPIDTSQPVDMRLFKMVSL